MRNNSDKKRIVIKLGTSTLAHSTGKLNIRRMTNLVRVISDLHNSGKEIILVSSGAVGLGSGKLGLSSKPKETKMKQAVAAVGQCELMHIYDDMFEKYSVTVGQILLTKTIINNPNHCENFKNTVETLVSMGVIPIVNENDSISFEEAIAAPKEIYYPKKLARDTAARDEFQKEKGRGSVLTETYILDIIRQGWKNDDERLQRVVLG